MSSGIRAEPAGQSVSAYVLSSGADPVGRHIVIVAFEGVEAIDVTGPASVFAKASLAVPGAYRLSVVSPYGGNVNTSAGLAIANTTLLRALGDSRNIDTIIVAGGEEAALRQAAVNGGAAQWVAQAAARARRVSSVCTGAFVLMAAGLLDSRQSTTHWRACDLLASMCTATDVQRDRVFVRDGNVWTSGGVTTGIDMALGMIEADLGRAVAMDIARDLALFVLRGGAESQVSRSLALQQGATSPVRDVIAWIESHLDADLSVEALAAVARMSPRNFSRAFSRDTGISPARYVVRARAHFAASLLRQTGWTQERIAQRSGFRSVDAFQRAFRDTFGTPVSQYRQTA
ncbi:GlxA family transcriptional regulator [Pandoraea apista]|uniref:Helix-turn-helix domain-containing protein n=1 Tax=Pandoraea apista TaxID=93218 RepID=A0ABX9ZT47_9BURK|nr:DJ-1/PfpI family protein [Pandoraea apista]PTD99752.1 AraC family transcriptional regulator [Pandoraea apista]RRJ34532.1 helix-turn-helix domain-containing protein [Pandoraea apista]RRJ80660.1 helix-turn-helix domain-containing protein [Pandoraea apista]RSD14479.1 helix-turn-helix domain-containing protein [Pandoraea apista]RSD20557.1 helix-turn-helix domain-containing protein [Pandoraea apista]